LFVMLLDVKGCSNPHPRQIAIMQGKLHQASCDDFLVPSLSAGLFCHLPVRTRQIRCPESSEYAAYENQNKHTLLSAKPTTPEYSTVVDQYFTAVNCV
jgi:hypothetical protein